MTLELGRLGLAVTASLGLAIGPIFSAVETPMLLRSVAGSLRRLAFEVIRLADGMPLQPARSYRDQDCVLAVYAPVSLLAWVPARTEPGRIRRIQ